MCHWRQTTYAPLHFSSRCCSWVAVIIHTQVHIVAFYSYTKTTCTCGALIPVRSLIEKPKQIWSAVHENALHSILLAGIWGKRAFRVAAPTACNSSQKDLKASELIPPNEFARLIKGLDQETTVCLLFPLTLCSSVSNFYDMPLFVGSPS